MNLVIKSTWIEVIYFTLLILYLGCLYPAMYCLVWFGNGSTQLGLFFFCLWLLLYAFVNKSFKLKLPQKPFLNIFIITFVYHLFRLCVLGDTSFPVVAHQVLMFLTLIMCINSFSQERLMNYIFKWHYLMMGLMVVGLFLFAAGTLPLLGTITLVDDTGLTLFNFGLFFVKAKLEFANSLSIMRPCGWYDEPGSFANVILFLLIYNRLYIKSKKTELFFLIGGIFTFSMAHIFIAVVWYCFFYLKRKLSSLLAMLLVLCVALLGYLWETDNEYVNLFQNATFKRAENVVNNEDQSRNYDGAMDAFRKYFLTGATIPTLEDEFPEATSETLWYNLAQNGLWGSIIFFLPIWYVVYSLIKNKRFTSTQCKLLFLLLLNLGQRPDYYYSLYFIFIYFLWYNKINAPNYRPQKI